ncbi:DUF1501 domain-containing protein [Saccharophagus degradans]|uniref:DUF1501 domain-containing protein n=1 Tax=Saccharophagus degradans TaxID=86304 RepID=UPI001C09CAC2|nr:DUF1501 domain-containing protein [Saccharophagus degradans]MBU2984693.1 DUF1501 domain-containing protein [Saccharophagus degradans]
MQRRKLIKLFGTSLLLWQTPLLAAAPSSIDKPDNKSPSKKSNKKPSKKIVWIMLRGAMDSLHAVVPPINDDLLKLRKELVEPIANTLQPLEKGFGLHPDLVFFHKLYKQKQLSPVVATATPYRQRSHFDAQDFLESATTPTNHNNGWLARTAQQYSGDAIAIAQSTPISLRGEIAARSWYPSSLPEAEDDLYNRLATMYENDAELSNSLNQTLDTQNMVGDLATNKRPKLPELARACATLLKENNQLNFAMMEMGGWDTHNNQVRRLSVAFKELDAGLQMLHHQLGEAWQDTLVIIATEFGRTAKINGTKGTDHGTASALFFAGGSYQGGDVKGKWPGLASNQLYQGRDLMPTSNTFDWMKQSIQSHLNLTTTQMNQVFSTV